MRRELRDRHGRRGRFQATFKRFGAHHDVYSVKRFALMVNVRDEAGTLVTDHLWFHLGVQFDRLELQPGDEVFFVARVTKYKKRNHEAMDDDDPQFVEDYRLSFPTKIQKLGAAVTAQRRMPLFEQEGA